MLTVSGRSGRLSLGCAQAHDTSRAHDCYRSCSALAPGAGHALAVSHNDTGAGSTPVTQGASFCLKHTTAAFVWPVSFCNVRASCVWNGLCCCDCMRLPSCRATSPPGARTKATPLPLVTSWLRLRQTRRQLSGKHRRRGTWQRSLSQQVRPRAAAQQSNPSTYQLSLQAVGKGGRTPHSPPV